MLRGMDKVIVHNDLRFFTNEPDRNLYDRFNRVLQSNTKFFDVLVGYFRTSGFHLLYPAMEEIEKIRILVGLNVDRQTIQIVNKSKDTELFMIPMKKVKEEYCNDIVLEMDNSEDNLETEQGIRKFIEWLQNGKIEIRVYPEAPLHAKVYIMRKDLEKVPDQYGSVITGSSNFSKAGLINNLEFNVELKDSRDVQFALEKFDELWEQSIDLSTEYTNTVLEKTWLKEDITAYELYLKTLYEYFKDEINDDKSKDELDIYLPDGFMKLQYQIDAIIQAKKALDIYGGVFISDVVGLGKTYICAMLAQQLKGRKLVICPPVLKDYWERTLHQFDVSAKVESLGKLDSLISDRELLEKVEYIFIDEAHRFRNENTEGFKKLHQLCYNKKVILITATPQNNYSSDIANQIYLFQSKNNSTIIPNTPNIENFFKSLEYSIKSLDRTSPEYLMRLRENSKIIRDQVLRNIMIRRTRKEIMEFYGDDLKNQGLKFPTLNDPDKIVYTYDYEIESLFNETIDVIQNLTYVRYKPLTYLNEVSKEVATLLVSQRNMSGFMKAVLIKRLESSFEAFKNTLGRFIKSYEKFINMCEQGHVYISKKIDVYELLDNGDNDKLMDLIEMNLLQYYPLSMFNQDFIKDLKNDMNLLLNLQEKWKIIKSDPKKEQFLLELRENPILLKSKIIIFTESRETAEYIGNYLDEWYPDQVIVYSGASSSSLRDEIEAEYNPNYKGEKKNKIKFLVTTDVLSEGINLHRSNVLVNYDLPWNPTKIMQRVGRINRVGSTYDDIYVFNFFPSSQANNHLSLEQNIILKIQSFHDTLGEDFKYLSDDEEVSSHNLYQKLNSREYLEDDETDIDSELKYLNQIRKIRDTETELFKRIKSIPLKSKSYICSDSEGNHTLSFIRNGKLKKFYLTSEVETKELTFLQAIKKLDTSENYKPIMRDKEMFYQQLATNKECFSNLLKHSKSQMVEHKGKSSSDSKVQSYLKALLKLNIFNEKEEMLIRDLDKCWSDGRIPNSISKDILKELKKLTNPIDIYKKIVQKVPEQYLEEKYNYEVDKDEEVDIEVILSAFIKGDEK